MATKAQMDATKKWIASRDNIVLRLEKETGAAIRAAAAEHDTSVTQYLLSCFRKAQVDDPGESWEIALPPDLKTEIQKHVSLTNETVEDFVVRAVRNTVDSDLRLFDRAIKKL